MDPLKYIREGNSCFRMTLKCVQTDTLLQGRKDAYKKIDGPINSCHELISISLCAIIMCYNHYYI